MDLDLTAGGFCGVVLAGGTAARMDGIDKASVELAGRTLLEYAVDAFLDALLRAPRLVGVLAVDMPRVTASTMRRLRDAAVGRDGAFLVDGDGRRQLAGVHDAARLDVVRPDLEGQHGMALHRLLAPLDLAGVPATGEEAVDVDSWADLRDLRP